MNGITYTADVVLCIDVTGSMTPILDQVKHGARSLGDDIGARLEARNKTIDQLRVRVVAFRDLLFDPEPLILSDFFHLPDESEALGAFLDTLSAGGGGDEPESGLEALAVAMLSPWASDSIKHRHIIVLWTDASAHPIEAARGMIPVDLRDQLPGTYDDLTDLWHGARPSALSPAGRRLVLFAPDVSPWRDLEMDWEEVIHFPSEAGFGLADFEYDEILDLLTQSI